MTNKTRSFIAQSVGGVLKEPVNIVRNRNYNFINYEAMSTFTSGGSWRKALGKSDVGNPWVKDGYITRIDAPKLNLKNGLYSYSGTVTCVGGVDGSTSTGRTAWPTLMATSLGNLDAAGATAISRCAPTVPAADTLVGLAEIFREGIPKMVGSSLKKDVRRFQSYGDEYLNYQFGWMPLVNDLRKLSKAIYESDELLAQLTRNSGKIVRRGYTFPTEESSTAWVDAGAVTSMPVVTNQLQGNATMRKSMTKSSVDTWFNGAFTYHTDLKGLTAWDRVGDYATKARHLYGIKLTPDVVWNLLPWSWLVDWETNFGDVISNVSLFSNDGLVMVYGYVMQHNKAAKTIRQTSNYYSSGLSWFPVTTSVYLERHSKKRVRATPWGFGLTIDQLSGRQMAILAALGISRI